MFLLARRVKATGVKMVLSGEGSDEVFGGYLYFHKVGSINRLIVMKHHVNVVTLFCLLNTGYYILQNNIFQ